MTSQDLGLLLLELKGSPKEHELPTTAKVDIVAIHGVNGHRIESWAHGDEASGRILWLADLLPRHIPNAQVMSFGYLTDPKTGGLVDASALRQVATDLLEQLCTMRQERDESTPLVFVGHSLGGVVIKELLWIANNESMYLKIAACVRLLVFFGTPFDVNRDEWIDILFNITLASTEREPFVGERRELLTNVIQTGPEALMAASSRFKSLINQYQIMSIYETRSTPFVGIVLPENSTKIDLPGVRCTNEPHDTDHLRLCKFYDADDAVLVKICENIATAADAPSLEYFSKLLECRKTIATLYPEVSRPPVGHAMEGTLAWSLPRILEASDTIVRVHGQAGSGKSVLSTFLANEASSGPRPAITLLYHFSKLDSRRRTSKDLLFSFLRELLFQKHSAFQSTYVCDLYDTISRGGMWTHEELWGFFRAIISFDADTTFVCIIDAIDECDGTRMHLLSDIRKLADQAGTNCRFIVTSRSSDEISLLLGDHLTVGLDEEAGMKDDKMIVLRKRIPTAFEQYTGVLQGLNTTILELNLSLAVLEVSLWGSQEPLWSITLLPTLVGLDRLCEYILDDIEPSDNELAFKVLSLLVVSARPFAVDELAMAIAVDSAPGKHTARDIVNRIRPDLAGDLRRVLTVLIKVDHNEVHIAHETIREFLVAYSNSAVEETSNTARFYTESAQHGRLAAACIRYLCFEDLPELDDPGTLVSLRLSLRHSSRSRHELDFLEYAALYWATHTQQATADADLQNQALRFLKNSEAMGRWSKVYWSLKAPPGVARAILAPHWHLPLEVAAHLGLSRIVAELLGNTPYSSEELHKALALAVEEGNEDVVQVLLQNCGADSELEFVVSALKKACKFGHDAIVEQVFHFCRTGKAVPQSALDECLCLGAESGHAIIVQLLITHGATIMARGERESTPLIIAGRRGFDMTVMQLLQANADADAAVDAQHDNEGQNALHVAARYGHLSVVQCLLRSGKFDVNARTSTLEPTSKWTRAIDLAAREGHSAVIKELVANKADVNGPSGWWEFSAMHHAASSGHASAVRTLLNANAEISSLDDEGFTPIAIAAASDQLEAVKVLLSHDADADIPVRDRRNWTPLHYAALRGNDDMVRALLDSGASEDPVTKTEKETPLHFGAPYPKVLKALLEYGANVNKQQADGSTALHIAARQGCVASAMVLIQMGIDIDLTDNETRSAAMVAAAAGETEVLTILLNHGADFSQLIASQLEPSLLSEQGTNWLFSAIRDNQPGRIQWLLDAGVNVNSVDADEESALLKAVRAGRTEVAEVLLDRHADTNWSDAHGSTLLFLSAASGFEQMTMLLLKCVNPDIRDRFGRRAYDVSHRAEIRALLSANDEPHVQPTCNIIGQQKNIFPSIYCDRCDRSLMDELFYHCCLHDWDCNHGPDVCTGCYAKGERCDGPDHQMKGRFFAARMLSFEEFSPRIRDFKKSEGSD